MIDSFNKSYAFLSNFYPSAVVMDGQLYPTVEHAFQAAKTLILEERYAIQSQPTPGKAKRMGRRVTLRPGWDSFKDDVMLKLLEVKFSNPELRAMLLATGSERLVEGNNHGDTYWGVCRGVGKNRLGELLMQVRAKLSSSEENAFERSTLYDESVMVQTIEVAMQSSDNGVGGPFGAAIVKDGEVICIESNTVLRDNDPTAHAEVNAIRAACKKLGTHDLTGCELYCTGAPCPMCMAAIIWSNIKIVYYCNTVEDAAKIGFRDDFIYDYIKGGCVNEDVVQVYHKYVAGGEALYNRYAEANKQMY